MSLAETDRQQLILVAEDDNAILTLVEYCLSSEGYNVVAAIDGEEALQAVQKKQPDLCIFDVMMPKIDGIALTENIRANKNTSEIPVILLSASVQESAINRGLNAGADDYINKPFSPQELLRRVQTQLDRH